MLMTSSGFLHCTFTSIIAMNSLASASVSKEKLLNAFGGVCDSTVIETDRFCGIVSHKFLGLHCLLSESGKKTNSLLSNHPVGKLNALL
jgi:hypothetical protein